MGAAVAGKALQGIQLILIKKNTPNCILYLNEILLFLGESALGLGFPVCRRVAGGVLRSPGEPAGLSRHTRACYRSQACSAPGKEQQKRDVSAGTRARRRCRHGSRAVVRLCIRTSL